LRIIIDAVPIDTLTCAIDPNSLYTLQLPIVQFYLMLRKLQLLQSATAVSIVMAGLMSGLVGVLANPSPPVTGFTATVQADPNSTTKTVPQPAPTETPKAVPSVVPLSTPKAVPTAAPNDVARPTPDIQTGTGKIEVTTVSGKAEVALAKYLTAKGVKFYGAYSCEHCQQQKALFGAKASEQLTYIECDAKGENSQRQLCKDMKIKYFPTWIVDGKYFTGTKDLKEIATLAGYKGSMKFKHLKKNLKKATSTTTNSK
jgi:glutaredoxin